MRLPAETIARRTHERAHASALRLIEDLTTRVETLERGLNQESHNCPAIHEEYQVVCSRPLDHKPPHTHLGVHAGVDW